MHPDLDKSSIQGCFFYILERIFWTVAVYNFFVNLIFQMEGFDNPAGKAGKNHQADKKSGYQNKGYDNLNGHTA